MTGNDIKQTGAKITLDKERRMVFDLNAMCELEERFGDVDTVMKNLVEKPKMKDIRYILFLALKSEDESLNEVAVGKLITVRNLESVVDVLVSAMLGSLPEADEKNA